MGTLQQVWEYKTITEVVYSLEKMTTDERIRHLIIGAGIVLGSKKAYETQQQRRGYWANAIRDQAEEAGLIAEEIKRLSANGAVPPYTLEQIHSFHTAQREHYSWMRPYGIIKTVQPFGKEALQRIGEHVEHRLHGSNEYYHREFVAALSSGTLDEISSQRRKGYRLLDEKEYLTKFLIELFGTK